MLHAGLDLSRTRLDYCLLDDAGGPVEVGAAPPDGDGLRGFVRLVQLRHGPVAVRAAIESMNGARFVHDTLERCGWEVEVADAQKVKGLAPLACKTDLDLPRFGGHGVSIRRPWALARSSQSLSVVFPRTALVRGTRAWNGGGGG
jgi:hypothetical protein